MYECPKCGSQMEPSIHAYFDSVYDILFVRDCLKCLECKNIMYTPEQIKEFEEKLKTKGFIKDTNQYINVSSKNNLSIAIVSY